MNRRDNLHAFFLNDWYYPLEYGTVIEPTNKNKFFLIQRTSMIDIGNGALLSSF